MFSWRACHNILPTRSNLAKRKVVEDSLCPCCKREPKTTLHVLWNCPAAQDVWGAGGGERENRAFKSAELSSSVLRHCWKSSSTVLIRTLWSLWWFWPARFGFAETHVFEGEFRHPNAIFVGAVGTLEEYRRCL
jgi:hypothetical protein